MDELSYIKITRTDAGSEICYGFEWMGDYPQAFISREVVAQLPQLFVFTVDGMIFGPFDLIIDEWDTRRQGWLVHRAERQFGQNVDPEVSMSNKGSIVDE